GCKGRRGREDGIGIDIAGDLARDIRLAGERQRKCDQGRLKRSVGPNRVQRTEKTRILPRRAVRAQRCSIVDEQASGERLQRLPAVEWIGIVRGEESQIIGAKVSDELDRRGKSAIERKDRRFPRTSQKQG